MSDRPSIDDIANGSGEAAPTEGQRIRARIEEIASMSDAFDREVAFSELADQHKGRIPKAVLREQFDEIRSRLGRVNRRAEETGLINDLNDEYFIMHASSKVRIGSIEHRNLNGHKVQTLSMMTHADFQLKLSNKKLGRDNAADVWLESENRREYSGFFIDPKKGRDHDGKLNLWAGMSVKPKKGPVFKFLKHLLKLVGHDREQVDYVIKWLAWAVQNPSKPIGTVLIFIGEPGTGKGTLGNLIRSIFGNHGIRIGTAEDLVGKHNAHLISACYAFVDEPPFAGNKAIADVLKGLVTEPTLTVEPKFQDRYEVDNMLKIICATNHDWAMQVEFKDRRYTAFGVPEEMGLLPKSYWDNFNARYGTEEGKAAVLHYLMNVDVSEFDPQRHRPFTQVYFDQKTASLSQDWLWWRQVGEAGTWQVGRSPITVPDTVSMMNDAWQMTKAGLYSMYSQWHWHTQRGSPISRDIFFRNANKWLLYPRDYIRIGKRNEQVRYVVVPDFDVIKERLEAFLRGDRKAL